MMMWIVSLVTGRERPNHRKTRVQAAQRAVARAQDDLSKLVSEDRERVRGAFESMLAVKGTPHD